MKFEDKLVREITVLATSKEEALLEMERAIQEYCHHGIEYEVIGDRSIKVGSTIRHYRTIEEALQHFVPEYFWEDI